MVVVVGVVGIVGVVVVISIGVNGNVCICLLVSMNVLLVIVGVIGGMLVLFSLVG